MEWIPYAIVFVVGIVAGGVIWSLLLERLPNPPVCWEMNCGKRKVQ